MPVDTQHGQYAENFLIWKKCRDVRKGEDWVKAAGTAYLPQLSKQDPEDYRSYKMRASFFNATDRTVEALNGALFVTSPSMSGVSKVMEDRLASIGSDEESFLHIMNRSSDELLTTGRVGLMVDQDSEEGTEPYIATYIPETIINWRTEPIKGKRMLTLVVLQEIDLDYSEDEFDAEEEIVWRVLRLEQEENGEYVYTQEKFIQADQPGKDGAITKGIVSQGKITPTRKGGTPFDYIPFIIVNPNAVGDEVEKSPILDLVNVNLSHYRTSADLEHGRHFTALPTAVVMGAKDTSQLKVGSQTAWILPEKASAMILEFTGAGLQSLSNALKEKEQQMAVIGSRLLEPQKRDAESADAIKLRLSGEGSVLSGISDSLTTAATEILKILGDWLNLDYKQISYKINKDFTSALLSPQDQISLMAQVQGGFLAYEEYFEIMKRARIIPEGRTYEEQLKKLEQSERFRVQKDLLNPDGTPKDGRIRTDPSTMPPRQAPVQE